MLPDPRFDRFLEDISRCFLDRNFALWRASVFYPFSMITADGPVVLTDDDALRENFDLYLQAADIMRLDQIVRRAISLEDCGDGTWIGTYETELLSRGMRTTEPYTSSALLRDVGGSFRMTSILNARGHHDWTGKWPIPRQ